MAVGLRRRPLSAGTTGQSLFRSPGDTSDGGPIAQDPVGSAGGVGAGAPSKPQPAQGSETPRERARIPTSTAPGAGRRQGGVPTPSQGREPSPVADQTPSPQAYMGGGGSPLGGVNLPGGGGLMGSAEGLLGGGLGVSGQGAPQTDILETLLALLGQMPGR